MREISVGGFVEELASVDLLRGFAYLASNIFRETTIEQPDITE